MMFFLSLMIGFSLTNSVDFTVCQSTHLGFPVYSGLNVAHMKHPTFFRSPGKVKE